MNIQTVGEGNVELIAGGDKIYTDIAARFVKSKRNLEDIIASDYNKKIVESIIDMGHEACVEFDWFIFGVEGFSRVTEAQLIRKRLASYMVKSGRVEKDGERSFDMVVPDSIKGVNTSVRFNANNIQLKDGSKLSDKIDDDFVFADFDTMSILHLIERWYNQGVMEEVPEEDLRYLKPQATEFKALVGMNARALRDWFRIRCCKNAQHGIRDMANKMLKQCKDAAPDLFKDAGPNCARLGYCPENEYQHKDCKDKIPTENEARKIIKENY